MFGCRLLDSNSKIPLHDKDRGSKGTSWKSKLRWRPIRGDRKSFPEPEPDSLAEENIRLQNIIEEKEQEITRLKLALSAQEKTVNYVPPRIQREELQVVGEALGSLRRCFPANDARQHTLDTIDQSLAALLERIHAVDAHPPQVQNAIVRRSQHLRDSGSNLMRTFQDDVSNGSPLEDSNSTKVVYYMEKSLTPFRCILHKRIGEATLRDFKLLFDRPGQYRYHFKTLDREFGMVKEEVVHDEDILPGWDSKIVAWIEEDCN